MEMVASKNLVSIPNATDLNQHDGFIPTPLYLNLRRVVLPTTITG
jgi:hypothetical protein